MNYTLDNKTFGSLKHEIFALSHKIATHPTKYKSIVDGFIKLSKDIDIINFELKIEDFNLQIPYYELDFSLLKCLIQNPHFPDNKKKEFLTNLKKNYSSSLFVKEIQLIDKLISPDNSLESFRDFTLYCYFKGEIEEKDELNLLSIIDNMKIKDEPNYSIKDYFKYLSFNWVKNTSDEFKKKIEQKVLDFIDENKTIRRDMKQSIISKLYTHIPISKISNLKSKLEPHLFLSSVNMKKPVFARKVIKNITPRNDFVLLNEYQSFEREFNQINYFNNEIDEPSISTDFDNNLYNNILYLKYDHILNSEEDFLDTIKDNKMMKKRIKNLDFIFQRKDFDLDFYKSQLLELKKEFVIYEEYAKDDIQTSLNRRLMHFYQFSFQNIYLMQELYKKDPVFYQNFIKEFKQFINLDFSPKDDMMNLGSYSFTLMTQFNVNNFLKMDQEFKEDYLQHIRDVALSSTKYSNSYIKNILQVIQKEPELGVIFYPEAIISKEQQYFCFFQTCQATHQLSEILKDGLQIQHLKVKKNPELSLF